MMRFLLDTNHLGVAIRKVSPLRDRLRQSRRRGDKFSTTWPNLFELEAGIIQTKNPVTSRRNLRILLKEVQIRPLDWDLLRTFGEVHILAKSRGCALSFPDKLLAALALHDDATILTADLDFRGLPGVRTENWLDSLS